MSLGIAGSGWVTPLGSGIEFVWDRLLRGEEPIAEQIGASPRDRTHPVFRVPEAALASLPRDPRLRRVSAISRFAVAAGLQALESAQLQLNRGHPERIALIFAISNGGVTYTRRFYNDIVQTGAQAASPLLFPETVFNAPASHLAALLETTGATYTLVGDGAVGLPAIRMAEDVMASDAFDYCLVVGAEEVDWLLCDAYRQWRLLRARTPLEPFRTSPRGAILSEGAGAILLGREGAVKIDKTNPGRAYRNRREAAEILELLLADLVDPDTGLIVASANGTFVDLAEAAAIGKIAPHAVVYTPKPAMGESVGASALWQVIIAARALETGEFPPVLHPPADTPLRIAGQGPRTAKTVRAVVVSCGLNQQAAGVRLTIAP